jgi:hypothetical protein
MPTQKKLRQKQTKIIRKAFREFGFACTIPQASKVRAALKKSMYNFGEAGKVIFPEGLTNKITGEKFEPVSSWTCGEAQCCVIHGACVRSQVTGLVEKIFTNYIE